jgi:hypothetical protein
MADLEHYQDAIAGVFDTKWKKGKIQVEIHADNVEEARLMLKQLRQQQKEIRFIKKQISADVKTIRGRYQQAIANVGSGPGLSGFIFGKKNATGLKASQKRDLRNKQSRELEPYEQAKQVIDNLLVQLDSAKLTIEKYLMEQSD